MSNIQEKKRTIDVDAVNNAIEGLAGLRICSAGRDSVRNLIEQITGVKLTPVRRYTARKGDVYKAKESGIQILLVQNDSRQWQKLGRNGDFNVLWGDRPVSSADLETVLNDGGWEYVGHANTVIDNTVYARGASLPQEEPPF